MSENGSSYSIFEVGYVNFVFLWDGVGRYLNLKSLKLVTATKVIVRYEQIFLSLPKKSTTTWRPVGGFGSFFITIEEVFSAWCVFKAG